ncbi:hypothetical protein KJ059_16455 [Myxococcota bacterium]|nr:hypothetical protein [Myxococcota bacterium]MCZ7619699.1 hypothetical protein [Myxococcota bacterium]
MKNVVARQASETTNRPARASASGSAPTPAPPSGLRRAYASVARELREHMFAYGVVAVFLAAGPLAVAMIFPEASPLLGLVGGLVFGVYAALCAVPDKFFGS